MGIWIVFGVFSILYLISKGMEGYYTAKKTREGAKFFTEQNKNNKEQGGKTNSKPKQNTGYKETAKYRVVNNVGNVGDVSNIGDVNTECLSKKERPISQFNFEELRQWILNWAENKELLYPDNSKAQFNKFLEEVFEFHYELESNNYDGLRMEMGDIFVTLIILCEQLNIDPVECLSLAYIKINSRKGKTINGLFVKEEDL